MQKYTYVLKAMRYLLYFSYIKICLTETEKEYEFIFEFRKESILWSRSNSYVIKVHTII